MHRIGNTLYSRLDDIVERASAVSGEIGPCWLVLLHNDTYALLEEKPAYGKVIGHLTGQEDKRYIRALLEE